MLHLTAETNIWLSTQTVDFRKQIDGLAGICRNSFQKEPRSGDLFVFMNRSRTMIRILCYEQHGYWLATKRLSRGRYCRQYAREGRSVQGLAAHELRQLLKTVVASHGKKV